MLLKYSPSFERRINKAPNSCGSERSCISEDGASPATCVKRALSRPQRAALCSNQALQLFFPWQGLSYHSDGDEGSKRFLQNTRNLAHGTGKHKLMEGSL